MLMVNGLYFDRSRERRVSRAAGITTAQLPKAVVRSPPPRESWGGRHFSSESNADHPTEASMSGAVGTLRAGPRSWPTWIFEPDLK